MPKHIAPARQAAIDAGLPTFKGNPCKRGHEGIRTTGRGECVQCHSEHLARWRAANPERRREISRESAKRRHAKDPRPQMIHSAKARAIMYGREFDLTVDDLVVPDICPALGTPMKSPSIDRVDSTRGYTKDNVRVISHRANQIKSDATADELRRVLEYVERNQSGSSS